MSAIVNLWIKKKWETTTTLWDTRNRFKNSSELEKRQEKYVCVLCVKKNDEYRIEYVLTIFYMRLLEFEFHFNLSDWADNIFAYRTDERKRYIIYMERAKDQHK